MTPIDDRERAIEAMLFASDAPLDARQVAGRLGDEMTPGEVRAIIQAIAARHAGSGIELVERGGHWHFQTPADLAHLLRRERDDPRKLSRAASEVLAISATTPATTTPDSFRNGERSGVTCSFRSTARMPSLATRFFSPLTWDRMRSGSCGRSSTAI